MTCRLLPLNSSKQVIHAFNLNVRTICCCSLWSSPRFPNQCPLAAVKMRSPNGSTRFCNISKQRYMKPTIRIKRAYDKPSKEDGVRVLVDRLWPRGLTKEKLHIKEWAKDLAPSTELRQWFGHEVPEWPEFRKRYLAELKKNEAVGPFLEAHGDEKVLTLIYAAKDEQHNHAMVLKDYLDGLM